MSSSSLIYFLLAIQLRRQRNAGQLLPSLKMWSPITDPTKDFNHYVRTFEGLAKRCQSGVVGCWRERFPQKTESGKKTERNKVPILTHQYFMVHPFVGGVYPPTNMTELAKSQMQIAGKEVSYNDRPTNASEIVLSTLSTIVAEDAPDSDSDDEGV